MCLKVLLQSRAQGMSLLSLSLLCSKAGGAGRSVSVAIPSSRNTTRKSLSSLTHSPAPAEDVHHSPELPPDSSPARDVPGAPGTAQRWCCRDREQDSAQVPPCSSSPGSCWNLFDSSGMGAGWKRLVRAGVRSSQGSNPTSGGEESAFSPRAARGWGGFSAQCVCHVLNAQLGRSARSELPLDTLADASLEAEGSNNC